MNKEKYQAGERILEDTPVMSEEGVFNHLLSQQNRETAGIVGAKDLSKNVPNELLPVMEMKFVSVATLSNKEGLSGVNHVHDWCDISYVMRGQLVYEIDGKESTAREGDVVMIPAGVRHREIAPSDQDFEVFFLCVDFTNMGRRIDVTDYIGHRGVISTWYSREIYKICENMLSEVTFRSKGYLLNLRALVLNLLVLLCRAQEEPEQRIKSIKRINSIRKKRIADEVKSYLETNYMQKISLDDLSQAFFFTPQYLSTLFRKQTGHTIIEYLNITRIKKAKEIFRKGELNVSQAALQVGFGDMHYFGKVFKQYEKQTPIQYIVELKGGTEGETGDFPAEDDAGNE
ncbi:AraC family transcriptional regulator [Christensenella intestinihominis]|uniref:AraC family transcriptional regulator n=1 Tax=Christensenella intestinihominis TaxID=1851429 RepID=UPI0022DEEFE4|nr:AraC family transcriptional regulator [Christensenella intestinihominis]